MHRRHDVGVVACLPCPAGERPGNLDGTRSPWGSPPSRRARRGDRGCRPTTSPGPRPGFPRPRLRAAAGRRFLPASTRPSRRARPCPATARPRRGRPRPSAVPRAILPRARCRPRHRPRRRELRAGRLRRCRWRSQPRLRGSGGSPPRLRRRIRPRPRRPRPRRRPAPGPRPPAPRPRWAAFPPAPSHRAGAARRDRRGRARASCAPPVPRPHGWDRCRSLVAWKHLPIGI